MALLVGIDLGTTYSVIAYIDRKTKEPKIIKNKYGNPTTPSVIGIGADGKYVIGEDAKAREEIGDTDTASFYKRYMGRHEYKISIHGKLYTAMELSGMFLKRLIEEAEKIVGECIDGAVITVPAYFKDSAKNDTIEAGRMAGVKVLNIINEPTAACVAYGLKRSEKEKNIIIYDLGGGTFDVTIAHIGKEDIDVLGTNGNHELGGHDWDSAILKWMNEQFYFETGIDISEDNELAAINMVKAEKAKKDLTGATSTIIDIDNGERKCSFKLTRENFENMTSYQLGLTTELVERTLNEIQLDWGDIDGAILVGGSTKMPMVREYLKSKGIRILEGINVDEAVAIGAAVQANIAEYCALEVDDKKKSSLAFLDSAKMDLQLLPGAKVIRDVISHSLGMIMISKDETRFVNDIMIPRNTKMSQAHITKRRELRVGRRTEKNKLDIYLLQGESEFPLDCTVAKKYSFYDIQYVEGGKSNIDITYLHTYNGTIDIQARQVETGKPLPFREEEIPEDMSWVMKKPKEYFEEQKISSTGVLVLALDVSGSMEGTGIDQARKAMINFVRQFQDTDIKIAIFEFSDRIHKICSPTKDSEELVKCINRISVGSTGYGNDNNPLDGMLKEVENMTDIDFAYSIVLTDGCWASKAQKSAKQSKEEYIEKGFDIIGMGFASADRKFLKEISTKEELSKVEDISRLNENLLSIARIINN